MSKKRYGEAKVKDLDLRPGDILLLQIQGVVGKLVWLMQAINRDTSKWTHAGIVLDGGMFFEAQPGGAVITPLAKYADRQGEVVVFYQRPMSHQSKDYELARLDDVLTDQLRANICRRARHMVKIGYNWTTYIYLAAYRFGIRPRWLKWRVQNDDRVICSQAVDLIYDDEGVHLFADGRMPYDVTPGDLARLA
ncbi:peptidase [Streptomyces phage Galactica]|nr:peptidase [Streptomyces phage Galactica]